MKTHGGPGGRMVLRNVPLLQAMTSHNSVPRPQSAAPGRNPWATRPAFAAWEGPVYHNNLKISGEFPVNSMASLVKTCGFL